MVADLAAIVLAAGRGTRMRSSLPKVLHTLSGRTILERVLANLEALAIERCYVVVGYGGEQIEAHLGSQSQVHFVEQAEQRGTGHAVQQVLPYLAGFGGQVLILNGDAPLLRPETLRALVEVQRASGAEATILTARLADPTGYGRVFLGDDGCVQRVVEHRDCSDFERRNPLINAGIYCYSWPHLAAVLPDLRPENDQAELYLPDTLALLAQVRAFEVGDAQEVFGINDRVQLAEAGRILNERTLARLMRAGVTIVDPASVTIDETVEVAPDAVIEPQSHLRGRTRVAAGCRIGPGSLLEDAVIEAGAEIFYSIVRGSQVGPGTSVGPYAHLRAASEVGAHCRIGNFVEIKNTTVGAHTNAAHLSYLGDASVGERVNFGGGTVIANYDGRDKHRTEIADGVGTGANSVLVAPLKLGPGVYVAAGSTVTEDVAAGMVIARPRQQVKPDWQPRWQRDT
ncbi:bifunctional UDP-N-acetylglucosamine diphosphorylase/glucosamine-1-phosphate N-acetyltransferase GlmU [Gloeobacter kilaueensis]|uniref:Bifunctional protein GlmU n=1 Tax=Gloeobacter kilaueensis (strain ATCC BAA-2537 / CCAP 1431/1 / ULC 316 / JS1) TaxID=1183438 RepID=U5QC72_GLOK1|nr:bifunctional UDP-N-acetylglucosamine diphosphorylase/glucosamine-1-phosphate N-acetyltransferase GlmU [Gloeobacter kilaueensis]AGY56507.1 UDP-N-acetylglucosamine pyrophosphorylase [Gloeobacter kilaueensis JS1]